MCKHLLAAETLVGTPRAEGGTLQTGERGREGGQRKENSREEIFFHLGVRERDGSVGVVCGVGGGGE